MLRSSSWHAQCVSGAPREATIGRPALCKDLMSASPLQWRSGAAARGRRLLPIAALAAALVLLLALVARYSHRAVQALAARVSSTLDRLPRDAAVQASASGLREVPSQNGVSVGTAQLRAGVAAALTGSAPLRTVAVPIHRPRPAIGISDLPRRYPAYIIINRAGFKLSFYEHL